MPLEDPRSAITEYRDASPAVQVGRGGIRTGRARWPHAEITRVMTRGKGMAPVRFRAVHETPWKGDT